MDELRVRNNRRAGFAATFCLWLFAASAQALTVDTGPGHNTGGGWSLYEDRPVTTGYQSLAALFHVDVDSTITSVQGWLDWPYGGRLTFALHNDFRGLPGARLFNATLAIAATELNVPDWRGVGGLNWQLTAGDYWLVFADVSGGGSGAMPGGAAAPLDGYASSPGLTPGAEWLRADPLNFGVRINVFPEPPPGPVTVPAPNALLLLAGGIAALLRSRRRPARIPLPTQS